MLAALALLTVLVHPGNTLSGIATRTCGHANDWTGIWEMNRTTIGSNPNIIYPGERLTFKCFDPPSLLKAATPAHHNGLQGTYGHPYFCGDGDHDGWDLPCSALHHTPTQWRVTHVTSSAHVSGAPGSFQACVIARESGGNAQIMNSTGHYGLYQFSASTWQAYGGNPADFGHASAAEQTQVFNNAIAAGGQNNWAPYDGC